MLNPISCVKMLFAVGMLLIANVASGAAAEQMPKAIVAVIDVNYVLSNSTALKDAEKTLREESEVLNSGLKLEGEKLRNEKLQLDQQKAILTPEVYQQKLNAWKQRGQQLQRQAQESGGQLNRALNGIRVELRQRVVQVAASVGEKMGVNLGLDRANIVFFADVMNITEQVLVAFNKAYPKINITIDKAAK